MFDLLVVGMAGGLLVVVVSCRLRCALWGVLIV